MNVPRIDQAAKPAYVYIRVIKQLTLLFVCVDTEHNPISCPSPKTGAKLPALPSGIYAKPHKHYLSAPPSFASIFSAKPFSHFLRP